MIQQKYKMGKKAILLGASGLTGSSLLTQLLADNNYREVLTIGRKQLDTAHPKLKQLMVDFDRLSDYSDEIQGDVVFCCLGTTKSKTPNLEQYKKIDYQYPLDVAKIALQNGATQYHLASALGADVKSRIFYSRLKGEVERDLQKIPFKSIHIYRPSLLDGDRKEMRFAENFATITMRLLNPLLIGSLRKYRSIKTEKVALAMLKKSLGENSGTFIYPSDEIERISNKT